MGWRGRLPRKGTRPRGSHTATENSKGVGDESSTVKASSLTKNGKKNCPNENLKEEKPLALIRRTKLDAHGGPGRGGVEAWLCIRKGQRF